MTISSRTQADLNAIAPVLRTLGAPMVETVAADMSDIGSLPDLIVRHRQAHNDMSALIMNAGVGTAGPISGYSAARTDKTMAVNFLAPFALIREALPMLRASAARQRVHGSKVVVLSSTAGVYAERGLAAYGASKAALMSLIDTLNREESEQGVTATAIAPGYVATDMSKWIHHRIPPHTMITPEDIATLVGSILAVSRKVVISRIIVTRASTDGYRA